VSINDVDRTNQGISDDPRPPVVRIRAGGLNPASMGSRSARAIALVMAIAAEPSWSNGQWVALIGSTVMLCLALGTSPAELVRLIRSGRP
jgi:hypothetical protein